MSLRKLLSVRGSPIIFPLATLVIGVMLFAVFVAVYGNQQSNAQTQHTKQEIIEQEHLVWCQAMNLLTSHPVPKPSDPAANPSREKNYQFYITFLTIKERLHC